MKMKNFFLTLFCSCLAFFLYAENPCELGIDTFIKEGIYKELRNKKVAILMNQSSCNHSFQSTFTLLSQHNDTFTITALFSPEHGLKGAYYAGEWVKEEKVENLIPVYSLHGSTKRPTKEMFKEVDVVIVDLQDIGSRSYTYATTLFYLLEEAAKHNIEIIICDRPNPLGGNLVDGPMLKEKWRSFFGHINVPYCHGMTLGELALFFQAEHKIAVKLRVIPLKGWKRSMSFKETGLHWIPTSPNIPEADTPFFYASTGILGEVGCVNIGIGYTQPFKILGAPWIEGEKFAQFLNRQKLPGVFFLSYHFSPFYGIYQGEKCEGVKIVITDPSVYKPLSVQYLLLGGLKTLYPQKMESFIKKMPKEKRIRLCQINGTEEILEILEKERYPAWKMIGVDAKEREQFISKRKNYLLYP